MHRPQHLADGHAVQLGVLLHLIGQVVGASTPSPFGLFQTASVVASAALGPASAIVVTIAGIDAIDPIPPAGGGHHGVVGLILIIDGRLAPVFAVGCEFGA